MDGFSRAVGPAGMAAATPPLALGGVGPHQRMEVLDCVVRRACTQDARTWRVWLGPQGRSKLPAVRQALARLNDKLTESFSNEAGQVFCPVRDPDDYATGSSCAGLSSRGQWLHKLLVRTHALKSIGRRNTTTLRQDEQN